MGSVLNPRDLEAARKLKAATLNELGVSPICVPPGGRVFEHSHTLIEEVVIVRKGKGQLQIDDEVCEIGAGSVAIIPAGQFHTLCNTGKKNLEATVVYNANVDRDKVVFRNRKEHFEAPAPTVEDLCAEIKSLKKAYRKLAKKLK